MATRRYYSAIAVDNTIGSAISNTATTVTLNTSPVGYPSTYPFILALDYNSASEELVQVTAISGLTLTIVRAFNGTTAVATAGTTNTGGGGGGDDDEEGGGRRARGGRGQRRARDLAGARGVAGHAGNHARGFLSRT